jgi:hypothetical protein
VTDWDLPFGLPTCRNDGAYGAVARGLGWSLPGQYAGAWDGDDGTQAGAGGALVPAGHAGGRLGPGHSAACFVRRSPGVNTLSSTAATAAC